MLSVAESAKLLGVTPSRVRALISSGDFLAVKVGRTWVLREEEVMARVLRRPKSGRPSSSAQGVRSVAGELGHETPEGRNAFSGKHELYLACKEEFRYRPNAAVLREAQSSEEAAFYMAIADFFLQQKQHELIEQGVY